MRRISQHNLRHHGSEVLRAVDNGESFEITNYGRVVARMLPARPTPLDRLRAAGKTQSARVRNQFDVDPFGGPARSSTRTWLNARMRSSSAS